MAPMTHRQVARRAPTAVLETPELAEQTPEIQRNKRPRELSESQLATEDQYIAKCLQLEAEGNKVRGWKSRLAKSIDRHGAWVTKGSNTFRPRASRWRHELPNQVRRSRHDPDATGCGPR